MKKLLYTLMLFPALLSAEEEGGRFFQEFLYMLFMLGLLLSLLMIGMWIFRKIMSSRVLQMNESNTIKIIEQRSLSTKSALYIVRAKEKEFLIAETTTGVTLLSEL